MRIIVPFTADRLDPRTRARVTAYSPVEVEWRDVSADAAAYHRLFCSLWADGEPFLIVEHDIGVHPDTLTGLAGCAQPWCCATYQVLTDTVMALGCTRFSAACIAAVPDLPDRIDGWGRHYPVAPRSWLRLDCRVADVLQRAGFARHPHDPVEHFHDYRRDLLGVLR